MLNKISLSNIFSLFFICLPLAFSAQTTFPISGNVSDKSSRLALPGVTVQVTCDGEFIKAVATDIDGGFKIEVGGHEMCSLEFSFVGYSSELF